MFTKINFKNNIFILALAFFVTACSQKEYGYTRTYSYSNYTNSYNQKSTQAYNQAKTQAYNPTSNRYVSNGEVRDSAAMHRATMRPYEVFGKKYYPTVTKIGDVQRGIASWYGPDFHAKKTSNGEVYDMHAQTAAHKTLPMNTMVRVDNLDNGKSTTVRINDRGPFVDGRIIDLSNKAAHDIQMVQKGTANVKLTIIGFHSKVAQTKSEKEEIEVTEGYYLQVGAFRRYDGALETQRKFKLILDGKYDVIINKGEINRVWISGFKSLKETEDFKANNDLGSSVIIAK